MPFLPKQNYKAPQLLLIFTLQVNLTEQEPQTIWAICRNTTITDPTEAHTLFKTSSTGAHKTDHITPTFLHPLSQILLQKYSASHKAGERICPHEPQYTQFLAPGWNENPDLIFMLQYKATVKSISESK